MFRTVSRINADRSSSSITVRPRRISEGGVGIGDGGTESSADEKIPNNDDDECAIFKLESERRDELRLVPRPDELSAELPFLEAARPAES